MSKGSKPVGDSVDVGVDESWAGNLKALFDDFRHHANTQVTQQQESHQRQVENILANTDVAMKNLVAQCHLMMTQSAENHRFGLDRLWAGSDTAQGGVDVATLNSISRDDASLKAIGAAIAATVLDALKASK